MVRPGLAPCVPPPVATLARPAHGLAAAPTASPRHWARWALQGLRGASALAPRPPQAACPGAWCWSPAITLSPPGLGQAQGFILQCLGHAPGQGAADGRHGVQGAQVRAGRSTGSVAMQAQGNRNRCGAAAPSHQPAGGAKESPAQRGRAGFTASGGGGAPQWLRHRPVHAGPVR